MQIVKNTTILFEPLLPKFYQLTFSQMIENGLQSFQQIFIVLAPFQVLLELCG